MEFMTRFIEIFRCSKTTIAYLSFFFFQPNEEECDNFLKEACDGVDAGEIGQIVS